MSSACTPTLVGMASLLSKILLFSKTAKFPLLTMDYSPWSSKNLIDRKWLKKFMVVGINVKCVPTNFGGHGLSAFGDIATFKNGHISLSDHYSPWGSKILINRNQLKRFVQVGIDVECMPTNFGGHGLSAFGDIATFKNGHISLLMTMDYSPWSEREIWPFLKVALSPKPERPHPPKLVCMHSTSIPTCTYFLS